MNIVINTIKQKHIFQMLIHIYKFYGVFKFSKVYQSLVLCSVFVFLSYIMCIIYLQLYECVACWDILFFFIWAIKCSTFTSIIPPQLLILVKRNEKVWMLLHRKQILQYKSCHLLYVAESMWLSFWEWNLPWRCFGLGGLNVTYLVHVR